MYTSASRTVGFKTFTNLCAGRLAEGAWEGHKSMHIDIQEPVFSAQIDHLERINPWIISHLLQVPGKLDLRCRRGLVVRGVCKHRKAGSGGLHREEATGLPSSVWGSPGVDGVHSGSRVPTDSLVRAAERGGDIHSRRLASSSYRRGLRWTRCRSQACLDLYS